MITLTQKDVEDLIQFANNLPTKYGLPLLQFIESKKPKEQEGKSNKN